MFGTVGFAIYGLAPTGLVFAWLGFPVMALWGLTGPASQGLMSRRIHASEQGQFQGALASLLGVGGMVGPTVFTQVFARAIDPEAGWHVLRRALPPVLRCCWACPWASRSG